MKNLFYLFGLAIVLLSCKAKKAVDSTNQETRDSLIAQVSPPKDKPNNPKDINEGVRDKLKFYSNVVAPLKFDQVKINSKIEVINDNYVPELSATIYIANDTKIWANINAFMGLVGARSLITPEGLKASIRTNKTYLDSDFEYLNNLLNVNFINYKTLEKLLMGRTFIPINDTNFILTQNTRGFKMVSAGNQKIENEEGLAREYKVEIHYDENYNLSQLILQDVNSDDGLEVNYDNYEQFTDFRLPKNVKIIIKGSKKSQILLENTKFDFSKMETPFSIPSSYKKIEIS